MNAKPVIKGLLIVLIAVFLIGMCIPLFSKPKIQRPTRAKLEIASLAWALKSYETEYGVLPAGESSNTMRVLSGDNPKKIQFLNFRRTIEHPNEMVDPWLTPYQIQFLQRTNFIICSAGKDKIFSNNDDIIFNSVSNDFVKP